MKKSLFAVSILALSAAAIAGPVEDKLNAYNAQRAATPTKTLKNSQLLLRNEAGKTSSSSILCATCTVASTPRNYVRATAAQPVTNVDVRSNASAGSLLTHPPAGLGVIPAPIARTSAGTGAAWQSPSDTALQRSFWAGYEASYAVEKAQYDQRVKGISNSYLDPIDGTLVRMRVQYIGEVEKLVNAWKIENPKASVVDLANYESQAMREKSYILNELTAFYEKDLLQAKNQFDAKMQRHQMYAETPPNASGSEGG